jgi:hypothetical protein
MPSRQRPRSRFAAEPPPAGVDRPCEAPGCVAVGEFRAPKSRSQLQEYRWFCLDHVRAYNAAWDFYKGMTPGEIEAAVRADSTWGRPTWPLGQLGAGPELDLADLMELGRRRPVRPAQDAPRVEEAPADLRSALTTLGLDWPVTREAAKTRWHALVRLHHPDANGGDPAAEERVKLINEAWTRLRHRLPADGVAAA